MHLHLWSNRTSPLYMQIDIYITGTNGQDGFTITTFTLAVHFWLDHSGWRVTPGLNSASASFSLSLFLWTRVNNCYHYWSSSEDRPGSSRAAAVTSCMDLYGWTALNMPELTCGDRQASRNAGVDDLIGSGYRPAILNFARIYQTDLFYTLRTWKWHHQGCPFRYFCECWISEQFALAASVFLSSFCRIVELLLFWACVVKLNMGQAHRKPTHIWLNTNSWGPSGCFTYECWMKVHCPYFFNVIGSNQSFLHKHNTGRNLTYLCNLRHLAITILMWHCSILYIYWLYCMMRTCYVNPRSKLMFASMKYEGQPGLCSGHINNFLISIFI